MFQRLWRCVKVVLGVISLIASWSEVGVAEQSPIHDDEEVVIFPTAAMPVTPSLWRVGVHGWVFEPEYTSMRRKMVLGAFCRSLKLLEEECDTEIFQSRARYFLVDNERGKRIPFVIGGHRSVSEPSGSEGHFRGELQVELPEAGGSSSTHLRVAVSSGSRVFQGDVLTVASGGVTVISDIDDTIKFSQVTNLKELMRNTFVRPFRETPGIVPFYQSLAREGAVFHYISASPWQLYPPLREFMREVGLPGGTFALKEFRWKDSRFFDLLLASDVFKTPLIERRITAFPQRRFVLIGDSGENDPEIYGQIARAHPESDFRIVIRELAEKPISPTRRDAAFQSLPQSAWRIVPESEFARSEVTDSLRRFALDGVG